MASLTTGFDHDEVTTEWDDIHRRLGNFAQKEKEVTERELVNMAVEAADSYDPLARKSLKQLDVMAEDEQDESFLEKYRRERLAELKQQRERRQFGTLQHVAKVDFIAQVTEESKEPGVAVVVLLHQDYLPGSCVVHEGLQRLAARHPATKFVYGRADELVESFQDSAVPACMLYRGGACSAQLVGVRSFGVDTANKLTDDVLEFVLAKHQVLTTELQDDPRQKAGLGGGVLRRVENRRRGQGSDSSDALESQRDRLRDRDREYAGMRDGW